MFDQEHWILETNSVFLEDDFTEICSYNKANNLRLLVFFKAKFKVN